MGPVLHVDDVKVHGSDDADVHRQNKSLHESSRDEDEVDNNRTPKSDLLLISGNHSPESALEFVRARATRCSSLDPALPALRFVYDSTEPKSRRLPVFTITNKGDLQYHPRGDYYKNVRDEWATLVATPFDSMFPDALAFTRSLGDFHMHSYGVSCEPTVTELSLDRVIARDLAHSSQSKDNQDNNHNTTTVEDDDEDRTSYASNNSEDPSELSISLLVASDGVWDNWKYRELRSFLSDSNRNKSLYLHSQVKEDHSPVDAIVSTLMNANSQRASSYFGDQADNMTAVLCNFSFKT